jgi:hypothetical protein
MNVILSSKSMISVIHITDLLPNFFIKIFAISSIWSHNQILKYLHAWCSDCFSDFVSIDYRLELVINKSKIVLFPSYAKKLKTSNSSVCLFINRKVKWRRRTYSIDMNWNNWRNCPFWSNSNSFQWIFTSLYSTIFASLCRMRYVKFFFRSAFVLRVMIRF